MNRMRETSLEETSIKDLHSSLIEAWNRADASAFAEPFTDEADYVAFDGTRVQGRDRIEEWHRQLFRTSLRGLRQEGGVESVRFIEPGLATMLAWTTSTLAGQTNASASRDSMQLFVLVNRAHRWRIESVLTARRITVQEQLFKDQFAMLSPGDQSEVTSRVAHMRH